MFSMKKMGKIIACTMLSTSLLSACSGGNNEKPEANTTAASVSLSDKTANTKAEPLTIKFFDKNKGDKFDDPIAKEITKRTGVNVIIQQPTGDSTEKLNLMLAAEEFPDIIMFDRSSDILNKYIASGALIPLDGLIKQYGPDVKQMYGDILNKTRYKDGKNYFLSNWYGFAKNEPVFGFNMKMDLLKELAPDKANGGVPFTADEFEQLLKDFKAKHPNVNGKPSIGLTAQGIGGVTATFKGMYGLKTYYEVGGKLQYDVQDPKYREMLLYINRLYREGLLDPEWALDKRELWLQKMTNGNVLATTGAYWDLGDPNNALKKGGGEDKEYYAYKVLAPGVNADKTTYGPLSSLGWDAIGISKANKHPEETMKFINFLASDEGQTLMMWGLKGVQWDMKDGKKVPKPEVLAAFKADFPNTVKETGVRKWTWFIKGGTTDNGDTRDMVARYDRSEVDKMAVKNLGDSGWNTDIYDNLGPLGGSPEILIAQKINDIMKASQTKVINAKTEEEAGKVYDKMLVDMKAAGSEKVEKIINDNYQARLGLWK